MPKTALRLHVAEPKASYGHRPPLVIDASVMAAALFVEVASSEAAALLFGRTLHAPHLLDHEIASVAVKKLRRKEASHESVATVLRDYRQLPIERHPVDVEHVVKVAERCGLTSYDAAYLSLAQRLGAPLATLDEKLAAAARAYLTAESQIHESG